MRKKELEKLLLKAVAEALEVDLAAAPAERSAALPSRREDRSRQPERVAA